VRLVSILEAGRRDLLEAASGISTSSAGQRTRLGAWTPLEVIEHVVIVEDRYLT